MAGASDARIIIRHLIPSVAGHIIVISTLAIPGMILAETALTFLGIGIRSPLVSWGTLLQDAQNIQTLAHAPWLLAPVGAIVIAVLAFNFLGDTLLEIDELRTHLFTPDRVVRAVDGFTLHIQPGETLGLVGESGCGKSVTAQSILRLLPPESNRITGGAIRFRRRDGTTVDLAQVDPRGPLIRGIRGDEIAMIFQEPMTSLSPVHTIGAQLAEVAQVHQGASKRQAYERAERMLARVGIANPGQRLFEYPHHFSAGMRQRSMIAMALMRNPRLLIAHEPTTTLDVTIQAQILELLKELQTQSGMAILMITHNLGVIAELAHRVAVMYMYMGRIVEAAESLAVFDEQLHPYTVGLLRSMPQLGKGREGALDGHTRQRARSVQHPARV